ncbi:AraC family transcriptional regulator [Nocardia fluminea]|uniref:AraC family transcriptional regulator n=1 Tax=Nocardia fluminea TaxID=134984 RepID=UPI00364A8C75
MNQQNILPGHQSHLACNGTFTLGEHPSRILTFRDADLTLRDMVAVVRAAALQGFDELVGELGADPIALRRRRGVSIDADPEDMVALDPLAQLLEDAATRLDCPDFGLRLAARQDSRSLGVLALVIQNAATLAQAVTDGSRYLLAHSSAYEVVVDDISSLDPAWATVRFAVRVHESTPQRQLIDACVGYMHRLAFITTQGRSRPRAISLPHTPVAGAEVYRRFFSAPVRFEQPYAGLHADRASLHARLGPADPMIRQLAIDHISAGLDPARATRHSDLVRNALVRSLGIGRGTKTEIAALLHQHPRALQRRLDREDTSFEQIRTQVYRETALRYLRETDLPLAQIGAVLGFSEQSAFTRACVRWFARPPSQVRAAARASSHHAIEIAASLDNRRR